MAGKKPQVRFDVELGPDFPQTVRATNTGATAIIDHRGVVTHALERHTRGVLTGQVQGRGLSAEEGWAITPYAWWVSRWGLAPLWAVGVCVVAGAAFVRRWRLRH